MRSGIFSETIGQVPADVLLQYLPNLSKITEFLSPLQPQFVVRAEFEMAFYETKEEREFVCGSMPTVPKRFVRLILDQSGG
jgi:hypothetical protein